MRVREQRQLNGLLQTKRRQNLFLGRHEIGPTSDQHVRHTGPDGRRNGNEIPRRRKALQIDLPEDGDTVVMGSVKRIFTRLTSGGIRVCHGAGETDWGPD